MFRPPPDRHRQQGLRLVVLFTSLAALACGEGGTRTLAHADAGATAPILGWVPQAHIDGNVEELVRMTGPALGPDGVIAIDQEMDGAVRFFDSTAAPLGAFGRQGGGPGEFVQLSEMGWVADTLWVWDWRQSRMTTIADPSEPALVRTVRLDRSRARPAPGDEDSIPVFRWVTVAARYPDGSLHARLSDPTGPAAGEFEGMFAHARIRPDGTILDVLARYPDPPIEVWFVRNAGQAASSGLPWVARPLFAVAGDGSRLAIAIASVEGPDAGTFRVVMLDARGDTIYARRYPFQGVPIPESVADSVVAKRVEGIRKTFPGTNYAAIYRKEVTIPPMYPPLRSLVLSRDGTLWIRLMVGSEIGPYILLDATGEVVGKIFAPRGRRIVAAQRRIVWVMEWDEYGIPSLVRYAVTVPD